MYMPNLKSVALPFPEIIGVAKKFREVYSCAYTLHYSPKSYRPSIQTISLCALNFPQFLIGALGGFFLKLQCRGRGTCTGGREWYRPK